MKGATGPKGEPGTSSRYESLGEKPGETVGPRGNDGQKGDRGPIGSTGKDGKWYLDYSLQQ